MIPSTVTSLGDHAFGSMSSLKTVTFRGRTLIDTTSTAPIHSLAFAGSAIENIYVPWSEEEHNAKFGSTGTTWGATKAKLNFNYVEE